MLTLFTGPTIRTRVWLPFEPVRSSFKSRSSSTKQHHGGVGHIVALEKRMLEYLERLNVPTLGDLLTVKINRKTYLPEVSTRSFDELSSQGLKTLVNVAHGLVHHAVAIRPGPLSPRPARPGWGLRQRREGGARRWPDPRHVPAVR